MIKLGAVDMARWWKPILGVIADIRLAGMGLSAEMEQREQGCGFMVIQVSEEPGDKRIGNMVCQKGSQVMKKK